MRSNACNLLFAFRQIFSICFLKLSLSSIDIPSKTASWDFSILFPSRNRFFVPNIRNWNIPGFDFNEFTLNHFRIFPMPNLRLCNISPNIFLQELDNNVLSSVKLHMSGSETKKGILFMKMLNSKWPRIDGCSVPQTISL